MAQPETPNRPRMANTKVSDDELIRLFAAVLRDPLPLDTKTWLNLSRWFRLLVAEFPLWSFQAWEYARLQGSGLPSSFPLQVIIDSILRDDGFSPQSSLEPLDYAVDRRRRSLGYESGDLIEHPLDSAPLLGGETEFYCAPPLFTEEFESEDYSDMRSAPYEEIGVDLVRLVEARDVARMVGDPDARDQAKAALRGFLHDISAQLGVGRPQKGPSENILKALVAEGTSLLDLCWKACPFELSVEASDLLADQEIPESARRITAVRLALPILSRREIAAVANDIRRSQAWKRSRPRPTPRHAAILIVARRLGMDAPGVARRISGGGAAEEILQVDDPFAGEDGSEVDC